MTSLLKYLVIVILSFMFITVMNAQENDPKLKMNQPENVQAPLAPPVSTISFKDGVNSLAVFSKETDDFLNSFGSLYFKPATAPPATDITNKLWTDNLGILRYWNDEVATGWKRNGNFIELTNPTSEKVVIGSGTGTNNFLTVNGQATINAFRMTTNAGANKVLTSDANGIGTWQSITGGSDNDWSISGGDMSSIPTGNVGIGTNSPSSKLSVIGDALTATTLKVENFKESGTGIYSETTTLNGTRYAGYFKEAGESNEAGGIGYGIYSESTTGYYGYGVYGKSAGTFGAGVHGTTTSHESAGVRGEATRDEPYGTTYGGYFKSKGIFGRGVHGEATSNRNATGSTYGGYFKSAGASGVGVLGIANNFNGKGVSGIANGDDGKAVVGAASGSNAFAGYFTGRGYFSGNVGIGIINPIYGLDVSGNVNNGYVARFHNENTTSASKGIIIQNGPNTNPTSSSYYILFLDGNGTNIGGIRGSGGGGISYHTTSDKRLKTNISNYEDATETLNRIKIREYERISLPGVKEIGVIAQELQKVFPQVVGGSSDGNVETDAMMVDYGRLTPLIIKSVQELSTENKKLAVKIEKLEEENKNLKTVLNKNNSLSQEIEFIKAKLNNLSEQLPKVRISSN